MDKVIRVKDQFYILAGSSLADDRTQVLKHGDTFAVFDRHGDIESGARGEQGLFHEGTRHLSRLSLSLDDDRPVLLSSTVTKDNILLAVDLANPDYNINGQVVVSRGVMHIFRSKFLWKGVCYERVRLCNYGLMPMVAAFAVHFDADFKDIFEVRGMTRPARGRRLEDSVREKAVILSYEGLDHGIRRTRIEFSQKPDALTPEHARFERRLKPQKEENFYITTSCESLSRLTPRVGYENAFSAAMNAMVAQKAQEVEIETSNEQFNAWLNTSLADLRMMTTETPEGPYPYAGVPWFSTAFGRDGIFTALECLWVNPALARGVLSYLAAAQAQQVRPSQDAEPGKILHETRRGEMAALKEIPFGRYYGSVDSTPLFVVLAGAYYARTADRDFLETLWPKIELALLWMDRYGDADGDGFIEYFQRSPKGLVQQGWKDSHDSVFHADGSLAQGPIALCEVQAYSFAARKEGARMARVLGHRERAAALEAQAEALREKFEAAFWCEELGTYALALDGEKRPCRVRSSNAGHVLFGGLARPDRAWRVAQTLLSPACFSGWGVRTVAEGEVRYNPMSYHNGSVWPHDNALIADGLARYGFKDNALRVFGGFFDASVFVNLHRLPELFCGFVRRQGTGPTLYPVACSPQAWAAGSVLLFLQACLGLRVEADKPRVSLHLPTLPSFLRRVTLRRLKVGGAAVDLVFERHGDDVGVNVLRRDGPVEITVTK